MSILVQYRAHRTGSCNNNHAPRLGVRASFHHDDEQHECRALLRRGRTFTFSNQTGSCWFVQANLTLLYFSCHFLEELCPPTVAFHNLKAHKQNSKCDVFLKCVINIVKEAFYLIPSDEIFFLFVFNTCISVDYSLLHEDMTPEKETTLYPAQAQHLLTVWIYLAQVPIFQGNQIRRLHANFQDAECFQSRFLIMAPHNRDLFSTICAYTRVQHHRLLSTKRNIKLLQKRL